MRERERKHCDLHFHGTCGTKHSDKEKLPVSHGSSSRPKKPHSTPTSNSQAEKALVIQAVQQVATTQQQLTHMISKAAQDKRDEAAVRRKAVTIVDNLVQNKNFKVHDIVCICEHMHACAHL